MANIKLEKILYDAFPLDKVQTINDYYSIKARANSRKYFEKFDTIYKQKWNIVKNLQLNNFRLPRQKILDIGAGPHIFAWLAIRLGHSVESTELPLDNPYIKRHNIEWFKDIKTALELDKTVITHDFTIDKSTVRLPDALQKNWDIITVQRSNFDIGWIDTDYAFIIPELVRLGNTVYYECAREQYEPLVAFCNAVGYTIEHDLPEHAGQGKVIIQK